MPSLNSSALYITLFLVLGCTGQVDPYESIFGAFKTSKWIHIHLTDSKYKDIAPDSYSILQDDAFATSSYHVIDMKDSLMAVADGFKTIKSIDPITGQVLREHLFEGKGPREYTFITDMLSDRSHMLIVDGPAFKVIRFENSFNEFDEFVIPDFNPLRKVDYRYPYFIYSASADEDYTMSIRNLDASTERSFHPLIIPRGQQPSGYNSTIPSISPNNDVALLSLNMPFLFIYHDVFRRNETHPDIAIRLHHEELVMVGKPTKYSMGGLDNPPPTVMESYAGQTIGYSPVFSDIVFNDPWIFIRQQPENRLLVLRRENESFTHHGSYRLLDAKGDAVSFGDLTYSHPWLYMGSKLGILKMNINVLN
ncbi:MAG: hypothetical protein RL177_384 [Bacteroidota bacterium]|jgi:hypothetical protein